MGLPFASDEMSRRTMTQPAVTAVQFCTYPQNGTRAQFLSMTG
jgi:hypothetical protein